MYQPNLFSIPPDILSLCLPRHLLWISTFSWRSIFHEKTERLESATRTYAQPPPSASTYSESHLFPEMNFTPPKANPFACASDSKVSLLLRDITPKISPFLLCHQLFAFYCIILIRNNTLLLFLLKNKIKILCLIHFPWQLPPHFLAYLCSNIP